MVAHPRERQRLGWLSRGLLVVAAAVLAGVLGLSRMLVPDPRGYGTHTQLGLKPCAFATLTGRLCPTCGMTTAYAWFVRGRIDRSWRANPAGCLLAVLSIPLMIWLLACAVRAEPLGFRSLSGPLMGSPPGGLPAEPGLLVDPMDCFAGRPDRRGANHPRRGPGDRPVT